MTSETSRIDALLDMFGPVARKADPWPLHWIGNGGDEGSDYCRPCAKAVAKHLRRARKVPEADVDGGWDDRREAEGPSFCRGCCRLLGYSLNRHGLAEEIGYWLDDAELEPVSPVHAYQIEAVLDAARDIGTEQDIADAIAIGERMAPLLPANSKIPSEIRSHDRAINP